MNMPACEHLLRELVESGHDVQRVCLIDEPLASEPERAKEGSGLQRQAGKPCGTLTTQHTDVQPGTLARTRDSNKPSAQSGRELKQALKRLSKLLEARANSLNKRCCTRVGQVHWQTRGRRAFLRCVATHLQELCTRYDTASVLYLAVKDYLGCLEKYEVDIEEEKKTPLASAEAQVRRWKAEGEAREWPATFANLRFLLGNAPLIEHALLSFDGSHIVALQSEENDEQEEEILKGASNRCQARE